MTIFDEILLRRDGVDSQQWPILNCSQANELALEDSDLRVDADRKILFYDANSSSTPLQITGDGRIIGSLACQSDLSVSGNLGVGTTTPTEKLDVAGKIKATDLDVNGAIATNQLSVTGSVTGSLTVDNGLTVNGAISTNDLSVTGSVTGSLTVENDLTVNGAIATNDLSVTGSVTGSLTVDSDLTVNGAIATNQLSVTGSVTAPLTIDSDLTVSGAINTNQLSVTDSVKGSLTVENNLTVNGSITTNTITSTSSSTSLDVNTNKLRIHGVDLILDGRSKKGNRALVDYTNKLVLNWKNDYKDGVETPGDFKISGKLYVEDVSSLKQEDWHTPDLEEGWQNTTNWLEPVGYFKDSLGIVHLKGGTRTQHDNRNKHIFTLAKGYRPAGSVYYVVATVSTRTAIVQINKLNRGRVVLNSAPADDVYILDGITFRAAD
jgi:cytoskeletal protein CcmA (bactofilin family)